MRTELTALTLPPADGDRAAVKLSSVTRSAQKQPVADSREDGGDNAEVALQTRTSFSHFKQ